MSREVSQTRRALFVQAGVLATLAATGSCAAASTPASSTLAQLGRELDACHAARRAFNLVNEHDEDPFYDQHWDLREQINGIPAQSYEDLRVKARAADYAFAYDDRAECTVPGSFVELSRSLIADLLRLQQSAA